VIRLTRAALAAHLGEEVFSAPPMASLTPRRIGAEVELIPVDAASGCPCPLESEEGPATLPFLRHFGARRGWTEQRTAKGTPCFALRDGGVLSFEPGGQIEYSSSPGRSVSGLIERLRAVVVPLRAAAASEGISLLTVGIDPRTPVEDVPLRLGCPRYARMAEHFARIGPSGARMMRQTASVQISLDFDDEPWLRWRLLNSLAPFLTAMLEIAGPPAHRRAL
jgi:glutamate--cysteine ligase